MDQVNAERAKGFIKGAKSFGHLVSSLFHKLVEQLKIIRTNHNHLKFIFYYPKSLFVTSSRTLINESNCSSENSFTLEV